MKFFTLKNVTADKPSLCFKPVDIICLKLSLLTHFSSVKLSYWATLEMALHDSFILVALHNRDNQCKAPCKRTQHCWPTTPNIASVCTPCCMLLRVVACCCAKFETGQTFKPTTPNISFDPWAPKVVQQCWIRLHSSSNIGGATHSHYTWSQSLMDCILRRMHCRSSTLLRVNVASVCAELNFARSDSVGSKLSRRNTKWKTLLVL